MDSSKNYGCDHGINDYAPAALKKVSCG
jgi:hypothetical protein